MQRQVCILTSVHPQDDVRIYHRQAKSLAQAGWQVTLLNSRATGQGEEGILFGKVPLPAGRLGRMLLASPKFFLAALANGAPICHLHDPELLPAGLALAACGRSVLYDAHENLPLQLMNKPWLAPVLRDKLAALADLAERTMASCLAGCIAATPDIARRLPKAITVCNYPDPEEFPFPGKGPRQPTAVYVGAISHQRGIMSMLDAAALGGWRLQLAGEFETPQLARFCSQHPAWQQTEYLGRLGREEVGGLLTQATCGLLLLAPTPSYVRSLPIKLFEYMLAGLPVVATNIPLWRSLLGDCGLFVSPHRPAEASEAVRWLLEHPDEARAMGEAGHRRALEHFNYAGQRKKLLAFYEAIYQARHTTPCGLLQRMHKPAFLGNLLKPQQG